MVKWPLRATSESKGNNQRWWERSQGTMMCLWAGGGGESPFQDQLRVSVSEDDVWTRKKKCSLRV